MHHSLFHYLDSQQKQLLAWQKDLVAFQAIGPENNGPGEAQKAAYLKEQLQALGLQKIWNMPAPDSRVNEGQRPNLAAVLPGRDQSRTFWIVSHLDVVPAGDPLLWDSDPFQLRQEGDLIYGRGVEDNQHGMVASLLCLQAFLEQDLQPDRNLGLLLVSDEETGNKYGLDFVLREHSHIFQPGDEFLVPDFGIDDSSMLEVAEKGLLWLKFIIQGKQCHASTPEKGNNSLRAAAKLILNLESLQKRFPWQDQMFCPACSTFEPTKKEANVPNVNTIPGRDVFYLDCRVLPDYNLNDVHQACQGLAAEVAAQSGTRIDLEIVHQEDPAPKTAPEHPLVNKIAQAVQEVYAISPSPQGIGGGTVAAYLRRAKLPAVVWATLLGTAHQPNEHASITNIIKDAKVMTLQLLK
ncbi:MAG: M20 family metallo-hydrolase [Desulfohalobiaceae bacterium]